MLIMSLVGLTRGLIWIGTIDIVKKGRTSLQNILGKQLLHV